MVGEHTVNPEAQECRVFTQWIAERPRPRTAPVLRRQEGVLVPKRPDVDREPGVVGPLDQTPGPTGGGPWTHQALAGAEHPRVRRYLPQPPRCQQVVVGADELHQRQRGPRGEGAKRAGVEGLDVHREVRAGPAQGREQRALVPQPDGREVRRLFDLRVHADQAAPPPRLGENKVEDVVERRDLELPVVEPIVGSEVGQALPGPQCPELRQSELLDEPSSDLPPCDVLRRAPASELRMGGDVCGGSDLVLVPGDEHTVRREYQVGFHEVCAERDRHPVGLERVLRSVATGPAVGDDDRAGGCGAGRRPRRLRIPRCHAGHV